MNLSDFGVLRAPRHVLFGAGQRAALAGHVSRLGRHALIVTDARMETTPHFAEMRRQLEEAGVRVTVFSEIEAELPLSCIDAGCAVARDGDPQVDVVVGIGGGSCLDAAKSIAVLLTHGGSCADYYGEFKVPGPVLPIVSVPTTSGTGSEVTPVAVLADPERALKIGIASPYIIPDVAICDPELTETCPPGLTAASGADALTHAIEALTTLRRPASGTMETDHVFVGKNAISDVLALEAIRLIGASLVRAVETGSDLGARSDMMRGALLAGLAFGSAGTAAAHAIQYPVGAKTHTAHGLGVATLMPYVMAWNRSACTDDFERIADALDAAEGEDAISAVARLFERVGIPRTLRDLGVEEADLDEIARLALASERLIKNNPRPFAGDDMSRLVRAAFDGDRSDLGGAGSFRSSPETATT